MLNKIIMYGLVLTIMAKRAYLKLYIKKFRTVMAVIVMAAAGIAGFFVGAIMKEAMSGAILFSVIAGIACIVYNLDNREA